MSVDEAGDGDDPGGAGDLDEETRALLDAAGVDREALAERELSYRDLVEAGVDADVAAEVRREFSLQWSFVLGDDLSERSDEMRNLDDDERAWIAASSGDWEDVEYESVFEEREPVDVWADRERPTPVERVTGVGPQDAATLAEAGITSARQLARAPAGTVADALGLDVRMVRTWRFQARAEREF